MSNLLLRGKLPLLFVSPTCLSGENKLIKYQSKVLILNDQEYGKHQRVVPMVL